MGDGDKTERSEARRRLSEDLRLVGAKDAVAMQRVYAATSAKLYGVCLRIVGNRDVADDLLQDVFVKVWHRAQNFDDSRASPITWLCVLARNTSIDWRRASHVRQMVHDTPDPDIATEEPAPDVLAERTEASRRMIACLDQLNPQQARAIKEAFFEGYTYLELAERQEVPLGTMKSWIRRGLERLRGCLDE